MTKPNKLIIIQKISISTAEKLKLKYSDTKISIEPSKFAPEKTTFCPEILPICNQR